MDFQRKYWREVTVGVLILSNIFVWAAYFDRRPSNILSVYFLDVGQGDAIFIDSPTHNRVLIDGGKNAKVLSELGKVMPFGDRRIDVVLATHPDLDHVGGLPEVFSRYNIGVLIESGADANNSANDVLYDRALKEKSEIIQARRGMTLDLGSGAKLVILFPNQDVSSLDPNGASIVAKLVYGEESFLLTGDAELRTENILLNLDEDSLNSSVLKVGHHGSRSSTFVLFAEAVSPEYSVISAGKDNSYGHPHQEVLDRLSTVGSKILNTAEFGTIKFETDGLDIKVNY